MKYRFIFILVASNIFSQEREAPIYIHKSNNDPQYGANIRKSEEVLNKNISKANEGLAEYSSILFMKVNSLPHKTIITKGITQDNDCLTQKNLDNSTNCIKIEQFDFIEGERGETQGQRSKSITLFFDIDGNTKTATTSKLLKIKSRIYSHNIYTADKKVIEVLDTDPLGNSDHDDKIFITSCVDDQSSTSSYSLKNIENTKSNPLRNHFKREAYMKHLLSFENILSKIFHYNEIRGIKKENSSK